MITCYIIIYMERKYFNFIIYVRIVLLVYNFNKPKQVRFIVSFKIPVLTLKEPTCSQADIKP